MRISKYHGLGNDFIITTLKEVGDSELSSLAISICNRHTGIGADGLIVVNEEELEMIYYNSDGSRAKMCGNGIRCFVKYIYDKGINTLKEYTVKTLAGDLFIQVTSFAPFLCKVNMGVANYESKSIPVLTEQNTFIDQEITVLDQNLIVSSLLLGATHTVVEVNDLDSFNIEKYGKAITELAIFPESTNANFFEIINRSELRMQTYERGAGLTLACGTGACAVVASLIDADAIDNDVIVRLPLGTLHITKEKDNSIKMEGPAVKIFDGEW